MNVCALIPSYDPDERLISTVEDLRAAGFHHIIVVDDGSRPDCLPYFEALTPLGMRSHSFVAQQRERRGPENRFFDFSYPGMVRCWSRHRGWGRTT